MTNAALQPPVAKAARVQDAKGILKAELKRRGMTYSDLVARLSEHGVTETEANLRNKLSRGTFTAAFFLQCLLAIGCEHLILPASQARSENP